jgi:hypothetical protein
VTRADALRAISQGTGLNVVYESRLVRGGGIRLRGDSMSIATALNIVLAGTGTDILLAENGSLIVVSKPAPSAQGSVVGGRIAGPDGSPVAGALVTITSLPDSAIEKVMTDTSGHYSVTFSRPLIRIDVFVTSPGFAARRVAFDMVVTKTNALPDIRLERAVQALAAVTTRAARIRVQRADQAGSDFGPGQSSRFINLVSLSDGLTGDPSGNLTTALGTLPNVTVIPSANGGLPTISAFGLASGDNGMTLNGLVFKGGSVPPDGFSLQAVTATYDPSKGGFAGLNASLRFSSGTSYADRGFHATSNTPFLQSRSTPYAQLAGRSEFGTLGAWASGIM